MPFVANTMSPKKYFFLIFVVAAVACNRPPEMPPGERVAQPSNRLRLPIDFSEWAFMDGKYYWGSVIRLTPGKPEFFLADSEYVETYITDAEVKRMYMETEYLFPHNREAYYQKMVAAIPREHIRALQMVWALPEVQFQAMGGDGGLHTLITWITGWPTADEPYYFVEIKRDYFYRLGTCIPISYVRVNPKTGKMWVMNTDGEFLPLHEWRRAEAEN